MICFAQNGLLIEFHAEKSILPQQINDSIYIYINTDIVSFFPTWELADRSTDNNCGKTAVTSLLRAVKLTVNGKILHPILLAKFFNSGGSWDWKTL